MEAEDSILKCIRVPKRLLNNTQKLGLSYKPVWVSMTHRRIHKQRKHLNDNSNYRVAIGSSVESKA